MKNRAKAGFTLVEMLVVIAIIGILASLVTAAVIHFVHQARRDKTKAQILMLGNACETYRTKWGDYPPGDLHEIGGAGLNDLNNGIEALVACLSSTRGGGPWLKVDEGFCNVDGDTAPSNVTQWFFGNDELREYHDAWGYPLVYFHHKDYEGRNPRTLRYQFSAGAGPVEVRPRKNPGTATFIGPASFQIWSVGRDGKPGTGDDIDISQ